MHTSIMFYQIVSQSTSFFSLRNSSFLAPPRFVRVNSVKGRLNNLISKDILESEKIQRRAARWIVFCFLLKWLGIGIVLSDFVIESETYDGFKRNHN